MANTESKADQFRKKLAAWLGISFEELEEWGEEVQENDGEYGQRKYAFSLSFSKDTPEEILQKMPRVDSRQTVYFNLEELG